MKKIPFKQLAVITFSAFTVYSCASSDQTTDNATTSPVAMSETTASGGTAEARNLDVLVVQEQVTVPVATLSTTALVMENPVEIDEMFAQVSNTKEHDVLALARTNPNLSTFVKLVEQADLVDDIQRVEKVTLFAPTNLAFANLPRDRFEMLLRSDNQAILSRMLQAHILASDVSSLQLKDNVRVQISNESYIPVNTEAGGTMTSVGGARVIKSDVEGSNGRIHVVDAVILPSQDFLDSNMMR